MFPDDVDFNLSYNNFSPDEIQVDETINAVFVVDVSPSISSYVQHLNHAFSDFVSTMQKSHVADKLLVSVVEFSDKVSVRTGFQPIAQLQSIDFTPQGSGTALYDATLKGLENAVAYRKNLESSGVMAKTLLFVITDGEDNSSKVLAKKVKAEMQAVISNEKNETLDNELYSHKTLLEQEVSNRIKILKGKENEVEQKKKCLSLKLRYYNYNPICQTGVLMK